MRHPVLAVAGLALLAVSLGATAAECRYSAPRNAELDAAGLKQLSVEIGPDELTLTGQPGLAKIQVHGTACASSEDRLADLQLETVRQGGQARVSARDRSKGVNFSLFGSSYAYLKLDVRVPASLAIQLAQGSGDAAASGLASLDATLGSGDLKVDGVAGALGLRVGSGDVVANNVGSLKLSSLGSGDATITSVGGDAEVGSVGSGDLGLHDVKGRVTLGSLASGDAKLSGIGASLTVRSIGSGDLDVRTVTGDVSVGSVASGDVDIAQAGGNVHVDSVGSGDIDVRGVAGDFSVGSIGSGDIDHADVRGKVSVPRRN